MPLSALLRSAQDAPAPDFIVRPAIAAMVAGARKTLHDAPGADARFAREMAERVIAEHVEAANAQHYELPAEFFRICLGPRLKYSCCLYPTGTESLAQAEEAALAETAMHAGLADGQTVLELGCGWGSLSLWMAERYPASTITAVSNSAGQRAFIEAQARERGLSNLTVLTRDMNVFDTDRRFDRIVSVEMFEHMANWRALLTRARRWLAPEGRMFIHVFSHRTTPYRFDSSDRSDFIAQHFFTGGVMPSHGLMRQYADLFEIEQDWRWSGVHYQRTALDWLANMDGQPEAVGRIMRDVYGDQAQLWTRRWRRFYLATAGLFGDSDGREWGVSHYRLRAV
ncbi:SAM-dependent methyltransferase [Brevundimonas sp. UBA7534]|uniref:SAM-dependent methyltransferase n=1 Tax=Brevundimonas sp. UBA7534 TaxID=1946138 RepID=UPI0025C0915A|nr:cyclopropane-fatty-acyl-phospholipid synthase family protein [Brevundimonas sp. UBA7534]